MAQAQRTAERNNPKIVRYRRKPLNINIGIIIFFAMFVYVMVYWVISLKVEKIVPYEVREGSLAMNYTYRALALRDEEIVNADKSGYVSYFAREGERVGVGNLVYIVDETGDFIEYKENASIEESSLSDEELMELRSEIANFVHGFEPEHFSKMYDFKYDINSDVMRLANARLTENLESVSGLGGNKVSLCNATNTGIVTYYVDGFEAVTPQDVTAEMFEEEKYAKKQLMGNELIAAGDTAYKLSKSEIWSLILPIEESMVDDFLKEKYIKVRFLKNQYESWGEVFIVNGADGKTYMQLLFNNSMITFAKERFVDIELLLHEETGLKIPNSSITNKEFFLVPKAYIEVEEEGDTTGTIIVEAYTEEGHAFTDYREIELYSYDEATEEYYIDSSILQTGTNILGDNTQEKYTVSRKGSLVGVYYMNKGYADFRQIQVLYQNEEYAIVKSNTKYGLNVYDHVVLHASSVNDDQFIYQ